MKIKAIIIFLIFFNSQLSSQYRQGLNIVYDDSIVTRKPFVSVSIVILEDILIWSIDRYIKNSDFSYISINTIKANLQSGFLYDNDCIQTNMFDHPFHGGMNFNLARSAGMNYWESFPFSLGGSLIWEFFLENEPPSFPDLVSSSVGGMLMGEVTHRLSKGILLKQNIIFKKIGVELSSFVLNPSRSLMRLLLQKNIYQKRMQDHDGIPIEVNTGIGASIFIKDFYTTGNQLYPVFYTNIYYNFTLNRDLYKPFDFFKTNIAFNLSNNQPLLKKLNIEGVVFGKNILYSNGNSLLYGIFQHYDYYNSDTANISGKIMPYRFAFPASFGIGTIFQYKDINNINIFLAEFHVNILMMGSAYTINYDIDKRNYNFGYGFSQKIHLQYINKKCGKAQLGFKHYKLITRNLELSLKDDYDEFEAQGDEGEIDNFILRAYFEYNLSNHFSLFGNYEYFYTNIESINSQDWKNSIMEMSAGILFYF